jgi:hypothetical protein
MSGFKIYNSINVNTSFLPRNYPDSLNFIVKGVTHKLSGNGWETSLDTVVIAQNTDKNGKPFLCYKQIRCEVKKIINKAQVKIATENPNLPPDIISPPKTTTSGETSVSTSIPVTSGQKADNVRQIALYLKSIGFTKEGTIGLLGNILGESSANPRAAEKNIAVGGKGGIGIVQWTASRRRKLEAEASNDNSKILDLDFQLKYLGKELQNRGHHVILVDYQPTSENMVVDFANKIRARLPKDIQLHSLRLQETESSFAEWFASDNV